MKYRGARIQVLDLPGIIEGAADGRGRGRQVISTARTCNLILIVLDAAKPVTHKKIIEQELFNFGIRINQEPPDVKVSKKESGGIGIQEIVKQTKGVNAEVVRLVCREYRISCAEIILKEDITVDQLIDVIEADREYIPVLYVFNKIDALLIGTFICSESFIQFMGYNELSFADMHITCCNMSHVSRGTRHFRSVGERCTSQLTAHVEFGGAHARNLGAMLHAASGKFIVFCFRCLSLFNCTNNKCVFLLQNSIRNPRGKYQITKSL